MSSVRQERITAVRAFTRCYTAQLGVLDEGLLRTPYTLTEARVLFELGQRDTVDVADLRRDLALDAGYLSRIVGRFAADGLLVKEKSAADARRQVLRLTEAGRAVFADLDARSAEQVLGLLGDLSEADQERLVAAMNTVREVLEPARSRPRAVVLRALRPGDYGWVISRNAVLYAEQFGWDQSYEALVAKIIADFAGYHDPSREAGWIAEVDGEPVGCVFCVTEDEHTARLRLLLVEPNARGLGIGSRLVEECLRFAERAGYSAITLWTNDVLTSARKIYQEFGFELVSEDKHHSFGKDLIGQTWSRPLPVRVTR
ncbi:MULTISPECIES: helix-turn-helix domain-containing GNAT family N-acetyltransferase [unclassified Crossiella]|uniref:bifunctional helix-turn-helix transcriptional regulator/GNAT family N-acetyltransferase n=1 Tax=unclassified Crossiella TaxID=2620835 RepID=UPI001FFF2A44|nr:MULTISPECIES: helix-turn-helix domain-containing GNAT family N-acetyltransferase [unclassified Crossiella]MCK2238599.1 helix-turn-helix domain-containing GNAT family N-acetyltransferase [Crossiella sp. S99.2]MCK2251831.1 helix-turn-helix domain-containing GNAT family N-acetyltransferase [Crossiella sp. S99.1]